MELRDGFIVSVFNYCDRWCETCALTSRCRLFADLARAEAACDTNMSAIVQAPPLKEDIAPPPPPWLDEVIAEANDAVKTMSEQELAALQPRVREEHRGIEQRATAYFMWVFEWLETRAETRQDHADPVSVIAWFASLNASKIRRALSGLANFDGDRAYPPDHEGSAKVALIGFDRSQAAWRRLVADGRVAEPLAQACIDELEWLKTQLENAIPYARAFIRPGFDEPKALAELARVGAE